MFNTQLFNFFQTEKEIFERFIVHSYSKSISEVFTKLLSVDSEEVTFSLTQTTPMKLELINTIVISLAKETRDR